MAVPFGFSVGDFISTIDLASKVIRSLRDSGGAKTEYQAVTRDLANLQSVLLKLESIQVGNLALTGAPVHNQTLLVLKSTSELLDGIVKFDKCLGDQTEKGWRHGAHRKMQWAVFQSKEVAKLRDIVSAQVQNLSMLSTLQILDVAQKSEVLLQTTSNATMEKIEASENTVTKSINTLSSAQDARTEVNMTELRSALETIRLTMQADSQSAKIQSKLLNEALARVHQTVVLSSNQIQNNLKIQGQMNIAHFGILDERIQRTQQGTVELSQSGISEMQIATRDIKQAFSKTAASIAESNAAFLEAISLDVEDRISKSFINALEKHCIVLPIHRRTVAANGDTRTKHVAEDPCQTNMGLFKDYLTQILAILSASIRRLQISLVWLLPLVSALLARMVDSGIPRLFSTLHENSIRFEDALGRIERLPYEQFRHWQVFESLLQCRFDGCPGESNVKAGMYFILRAKRPNQVISRESWQRAIFPGANINMSMIVSGVGTSVSTCPRCKKESSSVPKDSTVTCPGCDLEYHNSKIIDLEKRQDAIAQRFLQLILGSQTGKNDPIEDSTEWKRLGTTTGNVRSDIEKFRRIHMLLGEKDRKRISIYARTLTGKSISIGGYGNNIIWDLKSKILDREGIPIDMQRLVYGGRQLQGHLTVEDYSISDQSVLSLVLKLRGA